MRLVPVIRVTYLLKQHKVTLGDSADIGLLVFTLSRLRFVFLVRNPRACFSVRIIPIRLFKILLLGGRIIGLVRNAPLIVLHLYGTY